MSPGTTVADELGVLVVEECAVWCDPRAYKLSDSAFWTNYSRHLSAAVKRDRNHPFDQCSGAWRTKSSTAVASSAYSATEAQLAAMGRVVKSVDPTRPITYEADLDPGGVADALGLHYPHEYPDYQVWPNAAWWMDQTIASRLGPRRPMDLGPREAAVHRRIPLGAQHLGRRVHHPVMAMTPTSTSITTATWPRA